MYYDCQERKSMEFFLLLRIGHLDACRGRQTLNAFC